LIDLGVSAKSAASIDEEKASVLPPLARNDPADRRSERWDVAALLRIDYSSGQPRGGRALRARHQPLNATMRV
jgi:hypothetical protein